MTVTLSNDITIICFPPQAGKTLHMHSRVVPTHLHIHWHPHPAVSNSYAWAISSIPYRNFWACDIYTLYELTTVNTHGSFLSQIFWKHENLSSLSLVQFTLNYTKIKLYIFWQKIQAKQESSLTAVWLKQGPPVMWQGALEYTHFTLLTYTPEQICLPHCISMPHCISTPVFI